MIAATPMVMPKGIYRVYVRHNWGTDRLVVTLGRGRRSVSEAGELGRLRAVRTGRTGVVVMDVVPCRYVAGRLVETRKMRVTSGKVVSARKAKARASIRETRRVAA